MKVKLKHDSSVTQQQHEEKLRKQQFGPKSQSKNIRSALVKDKGSINLPCYYLERAGGTNLSPSWPCHSVATCFRAMPAEGSTICPQPRARCSFCSL